MAETQVLIVGAGPTGLTAAFELSRFGVKVRIVDAAAAPSTTSRAIGVQPRTLELFEQRGLVDRMLKLGNPATAACIYAEGKQLFRLQFEHNGSAYGYILLLSQAETEATLQEAAAARQVSVERSVQLVALAQPDHGEHVTAVLRHADSSLEEVKCSYLMDAEGAHSICRTTLGIPFAGKTRQDRYVLGDIRVDGNLPAGQIHIFSSEFGLLAMFPLGEGHFRLIASNPPAAMQEAEKPSLEQLQKIYDTRSHMPARFHDMAWSSWFRINSRMVNHMRQGRIFLGGDSAHIHSPAGGQGMNTGIQDMVNLCWKLALVLQGRASGKLLDTYDADRLPVIRGVLANTEGLTDVVGSDSALLRSVFRHVAPWFVSMESVQDNASEKMGQLALHYRTSPLSVNAHFPGGLHAGDRVPNLTVQEVDSENGEQQPGATNLFPLLSPDRFTLLLSNPDEPVPANAAVQETLSPWQDLINIRRVAPPADAAENDEDTMRYREAFGTGPGIVLVRPDGYAAFTGSRDSLPQLVQYLEEWLPRAVPNATESAQAHAGS